MGRPASDLTGQQFEQLIAISATDKRNHNKTILWLCKCTACGTEVELPSTKLKNLEVLSCGCKEHVRSPRTQPGDSGFNSLYQQYQFGAKRRELEFQLSKEEFKALTQQLCSYCGANPSNIRYGSIGDKREYGKYIYNGIDRVDNSIGYITSNCITCCHECNIAKGSRNSDEFINWIHRVYNFTSS